MNKEVMPPFPRYQPTPPQEQSDLSLELSWVAGLIFLTVALLLLLLGQTPAYNNLVGAIAINFLAMMVEAMPFMLIGSLAGGVIEVFVPVTWVERVCQNHRFRAVFIGGAMGLVFPVCECAVVPVIRRLLGKGAPFGAAVAFLLGGPIVNLLVAASTAVAYSFNWQVVALRLGCGYLIAVTVGLLLSRWFTNDNALVRDARTRSDACCGHDHCAFDGQRPGLMFQFRHALAHASDDFFSVGYYLVIGAFIAAFVRSVVSLEAFNHFLAAPWQAILLMMTMAVVLNLCSEADAFIAASFRGLLPPSAQLAFMVLGPMFDLKLLLMYFGLFRKRVISSLVATVLGLVFLTMLVVHQFSPNPF